MANNPGKLFVILIEDTAGSGTWTVIAAGQSHNWTVNNSEVEINTKDSGSWRDLFPAGAIISISASLTFVFTSTADQARLVAVSETTTGLGPVANFKLRDGAGEDLHGDFQVSSLEHGGETEGMVSINGTLSSTGPIARIASV